MNATQKMNAARASLAKRFHSGAGRVCMVILDVLVLLCKQNPTHALMDLPELRSLPGHWLSDPGRLGYRRVKWFKARSSDMKICVYSERMDNWLSPYRVRIIADDRTGLTPDEVLRILEVMPKHRLTILELAFDFSFASGVTRDFVRRYGVFGKSRRDKSNNNPMGEWWGARTSAKRVKSYFKDEVCGHRVEFVLRSGFFAYTTLQTCSTFTLSSTSFPHVIFFSVGSTKSD
jgi:hypothetical protein